MKGSMEGGSGGGGLTPGRSAEVRDMPDDKEKRRRKSGRESKGERYLMDREVWRERKDGVEGDRGGEQAG